MDEYIRRDDAIRLAEQGQIQVFPWQFQMLVRLPAVDVVPVVRCKDCKYCIASRQRKLFCIHGFEQTIISAFAAIDNPIFEREYESFCSYGERKE